MLPPTESPISLPNNQAVPLDTVFNIVGVFDQSGGLPGTMSLYTNGVIYGSTAIVDTLDLANNLNDVNNWLGRSQWIGDPVFDGAYDQFDVYDNALSNLDVASLYALGTVPVPEPGSLVLLTLGLAGVGLARRRRCQRWSP